MECYVCHGFGYFGKQCLRRQIWVKKGTKNQSDVAVSLDDSPSHYLTDTPLIPVSATEDVADRVINGEAAGDLYFERDNGQSVHFDFADEAGLSTVVPVSSEIVIAGLTTDVLGNQSGVPENLSNVSTVVLSELDMRLSSTVFVYSQSGFEEMIFFFNNHIYSDLKCLLPASDTMRDVACEPVVINAILLLKLNETLNSAMLKKVFTGTFLLDSAVSLAVLMMVYPSKRSWAEAFEGICLDENGMLVCRPAQLTESVNSLATNDIIQNPISEVQSAHYYVSLQSQELDISSAAPARRRGRPRKQDTSQSQVRYCTRNNNEGYKEQALPDRAPRRKVSAVPKASTPAILQITEMQRLGVEKCQIDPDELTEERLLQGRPE
jgi:hypothetical protein